MKKFSTNFPPAALIASLLLPVSTSSAGGGGGSGRPVTPYRDSKVSVEEIVRQKDTARMTMDIEVIRAGSDERLYFEYGALARLKKQLDPPSPFHEISGTGKDGKAQSITFECIKELTILSMAKDTATVRAIIFPAISPDSLRLINPTYSLLDSAYKDSAEIKLPVADRASKKNLYLLGKKFGNGDYANTFPIKSLKKGDRIIFSIDRHHIWWAVPSVAGDKNYPFRYYMKK